MQSKGFYLLIKDEGINKRSLEFTISVDTAKFPFFWNKQSLMLTPIHAKIFERNLKNSHHMYNSLSLLLSFNVRMVIDVLSNLL